MSDPKMIDVTLSRIVLRDGADRQYIFLSELDGPRGFPIVIGNNEAGEIQRVVHDIKPERPLTHQLLHVGRLEAELPRFGEQPLDARGEHAATLPDTEGRCLVGDEDAVTLAGDHHALVLELAVGARHGVVVDQQALGEAPHRGQPLARAQSPRGDVAGEGVDKGAMVGHRRDCSECNVSIAPRQWSK